MKKRIRPKRSSTYNCWVNMRSRCRDPNQRQYKDYGGRGIRVCERWDSYENFLADMGEKPDGYSIDRIDVNGHYEPSNCRWATQKEQMRNQRITRKVTIEGKSYIAADLADILGVKTDTVIQRAKVCKTYAEVMDPSRRVYTDGLALGGIANGKRIKAKTHCPYGHPFDQQNTSYSPEGWRRCKRCHADRQLKRSRRLRNVIE